MDTKELTKDESGVAVLVGGQIVAWFSKFDEEVENWCRENYYGKWITWRATYPELIPLSEDEKLKLESTVEELSKFFIDKRS